MNFIARKPDSSEHKPLYQGDHKLLERNGYVARHFMAVSGNRNEGSIKSFTKTDKTTKNKMAGCLMSVVPSNNDDQTKAHTLKAPLEIRQSRTPFRIV